MDTVAYIDPSLPFADKMELINKNLSLLQGAWESQNADKSELDSIYALIQMSRKWKRGQGVGNTSGTYSGWTHFKAEAGYSIWKYVISDFANDIDNRLFFDGKSLTYMGQATTESDTSFDNVFTYDGSTYTDRTTEAGSEAGTPFALLADADDYVYIGHATQFSGFDLEFATLGSGHTLVLEYSKGAGVWGTINVANIMDNTKNFIYSGNLSFIIPGDFVTDTVNGVASKYWIRVKTTTVPSIIATAYFCKPINNVSNILSISSNQAREERWTWCSLGTAIYVTIRNAGNALYEGDYYITSASSSANKENFFAYNHQFTADYQDLNYSSNAGIFAQKAANETITGNWNFSNNVGIGTTNPQRQLHIGDGLNTGVDGYIRLQGYSASGTNYHEISSEGDNFYIGRNGNTQLFVQYDGKVGIGTTTPDTTLHVYEGDSGGVSYPDAMMTIEKNQSIYLQFLSPNSSEEAILFCDPQNNDQGVFRFSHVTNSFGFSTDGGGNDYVRINSSGQLVLTLATGTAPFSVASRTVVDNLRVEGVNIVAAGSLPAAGSSQDGKVVIENVGAGDQNLIIYSNGQRFRIDGGSVF